MRRGPGRRCREGQGRSHRQPFSAAARCWPGLVETCTGGRRSSHPRQPSLPRRPSSGSVFGATAGSDANSVAVPAPGPGARARPPACQPTSPSPGYLVLAAVPGALSAAHQLRDGQRGPVRLVGGGGQAHVGAGRRRERRGSGARGVRPRLGAAAPRSARTARGRGGADKQAARPRPAPVTPPPYDRARQCGRAAQQGSAHWPRRGGWSDAAERKTTSRAQLLAMS